MDLLLYIIKVIFSPIIYLIKGIKICYNWFYEKWNDADGNLEDRLIIGVLYTLFLIILTPIVLSPMLLLSVVTVGFWFALSFIGTLFVLIWGWCWIMDL